MSFDYARQIVLDRLRIRATQLHETAETLPQGGDREGLLHKAHKMETASRVIDRWLASPGLRAPD
jgi:hypothetical protein